LQTEAARLCVIDFRPWIVSGHHDLISVFFKVLSEALADEKSTQSSRWKKALRLVRAGSDPLIEAAAKISLIADPSGGIASKTALAVAKKSLNDAIDGWLKEPSLQSAYDDLRERLEARGERILVIIDDIDRLDRTEIRTIMQLVKTVGRLPNVIYLLAYDRKIVWKALDDDAPQGVGLPSFAEKIVQHELELPQPARSALLRILDSEIAFLGDEAPAAARWQTLVVNGVQQWIRYPRDVMRLSNAVKFAWSALENEIDPQDLLCMEGLRLFDAPLFDWIRRNRDFLLNQGRYRMFSEERKAPAFELLRNSLAPETREDQLELLCALFPAQTKIIRGEEASRFGGEAYFELVRRRGIGCEAGYDAYFSQFPSPNSIPKTVIDTAIRQLDDEAAQLGFLRDYLDKRDERGVPLIGDYLEELNFRFLGPGAARPTHALLDALFEIGEDIQRIDWEEDVFPPKTRLSLLIRDLLDAWGTEQADTALLAAFAKCGSPAFCAGVWLERGRELGEIPDRDASPANLISVDAFNALGVRLHAMIEAGAESGSLESAPSYFAIARAWAHLGGDEVVREWISKGVSTNARFLAKVANFFLVVSPEQDGLVYSFQARQDAPYYPLDDMREACARHVSAAGLSRDEAARIHALKDGLDNLHARETRA
jgi:hypothetical protein